MVLLVQFLLFDYAGGDEGVLRVDGSVRTEVVARNWIPASAAALAAGLLQPSPESPTERVTAM